MSSQWVPEPCSPPTALLPWRVREDLGSNTPEWSLAGSRDRGVSPGWCGVSLDLHPCRGERGDP